MHIRQYTLFATTHPAILLVYALGAPVVSMLSKSPVSLGITFVCALLVHSFYLGSQALKDGLKMTMPFVFVIAVFNMMTNPGGVTVLAKIGTRSLTLESLAYGLASGIMLAAVILWFRCFPAIIPNDKFLYLFGCRFQGTGLLLSMILKLFPDTRYKIRCIRMADISAGDANKASVGVRLKKGLRQMSVLLVWSMEDSIDTADSMKARGYGITKRTSYERRRFAGYDICVLTVTMVLFVISAAGAVWQDALFTYYPGFYIQKSPLGMRIMADSCCMIFLLLPIWMESLKKGGIFR